MHNRRIVIAIFLPMIMANSNDSINSISVGGNSIKKSFIILKCHNYSCIFDTAQYEKSNKQPAKNENLYQ